jgi:hypothetical protein
LYPQTVTESPPERIFTGFTDGRKIWYVDQFGVPLCIDTNNSSSLLSQRFALLKFARKLLPKERTANCFYSRISVEHGVDVLLNKTKNKANYGNLQRCASGWACPVCASILSESRKNDVKKSMDWWKSQGGSVLLMTLTNSHHAGTDLKALKLGQRKAMQYLMGGTRESRRIFQQIGKVHHIGAYEITHGKNGFHPHYHVLLFCQNHVNDPKNSVTRDLLAQEWISSCEKAGLPLPDMEHGLDLQDGAYADSYVNKWGLEHEMTKGHIKRGKNGSMTPFDLLRDYAENQNEESGRLFQQYALTFKGSRQLNWSRGLKKSAGCNEKTDEQIVAETEKMSEKMFLLDIELWHAVRSQNKRGELLAAVQDDHTLQKAMELVRDCVTKNVQPTAKKRQCDAVTRNTETLTHEQFKKAITKNTKNSALIEKLSRHETPKLLC